MIVLYDSTLYYYISTVCSYMARSVVIVRATLAYCDMFYYGIMTGVFLYGKYYDSMMFCSYMASSVVIVSATLAGADLWSSQNDIHETHT